MLLSRTVCLPTPWFCQPINGHAEGYSYAREKNTTYLKFSFHKHKNQNIALNRPAERDL